VTVTRGASACSHDPQPCPGTRPPVPIPTASKNPALYAGWMETPEAISWPRAKHLQQQRSTFTLTVRDQECEKSLKQIDLPCQDDRNRRVYINLASGGVFSAAFCSSTHHFNAAAELVQRLCVIIHHTARTGRCQGLKIRKKELAPNVFVVSSTTAQAHGHGARGRPSPAEDNRSTLKFKVTLDSCSVTHVKNEPAGPLLCFAAASDGSRGGSIGGEFCSAECRRSRRCRT
jgi:hypothetical protein